MSAHSKAWLYAAETMVLGGCHRAAVKIVLAFLGVGLLLVAYIRHISYQDPTSFSFQPELAYEHRYSAIRQQEAEDFIAQASTLPYLRSNATHPRLCIGVPSIARSGVSYLPTTIGSLFQGLSQDERDEVELIVFIAATDPSRHPAFGQPWLANAADRVLLYNLSDADLAHVAEMEHGGKLFREKGLFDYTYVLRACIASEAPHIAMLEDDVLALDGWLHRTMRGIEDVERHSGERGLLYLRLFFTEQFLGWNREHAQTYLAVSLLIILVSGLALLAIHTYTTAHRGYLTLSGILWISFVVVPVFILLWFAAGRVTVLPMSQGVTRMNNYGCCAQGLVYPRDKAQKLVEWYESSHVGFVDTLTEQYADKHGEQRWALVPSVLQHIGAKSSKGDDLGKGAKHNRPVAGTIWNFAFELNNFSALRREHLAHLDSSPLSARS